MFPFFALQLLACLWLASRVREELGTPGKWLGLLGVGVGWLQIAGLLADLVEDVGLLVQLDGDIRDGLVGLISWASAGKFLVGAAGALTIVLLAAVLVVPLQRRFPVLQYLWYCRFPILFALVLIGLGPFSVLVLPQLLNNQFDLSGWEFAAVAWVSGLGAWTVLLTLRNILLYAHLRFDHLQGPEAVTEWVRTRQPLLVAWLVGPVLLTALTVSTQPGVGPLLWILLGLAAAWLLLLAARRLGRNRIYPGFEAEMRQTTALESRAALESAGRGGWFCRLGPGYCGADGRLLPGHSRAALFLGLTFLLYLFLYFFFVPHDPIIGVPPTLAFVLVLIVAGAWILPGVAFYLDRFRIPTVLVAALFVFVSIFPSDYYYRVHPRGDGAPPVSPVQALEAARHPDGHPVVLVAASGGGITASLWTTRVLTALQESVGDDFIRSVRVISSVSGGSAGTIFYLDAFTEDGFPPPSEAEEVMKASSEPSLPSLGWGIAYLDIWRGLLPVLYSAGLRDPLEDRSWALEEIWRTRLESPQQRLSDWSAAVGAGWLPAAILNTTISETGRQYLFTPLAVPDEWNAESLHREDADADVDVVSAARLSATFAYVTPIARGKYVNAGEKDTLQHHLADGGYYDNFGVVSLINWVQTVAHEEPERLSRGVVIVLIRALTVAALTPPRQVNWCCQEEFEPQQGWVYATLGPILTLEAIRTATQLRRNELELDLLEKRWAAEGIPIRVFEFDLTAEVPLSWKLTEGEKQVIRAGWDEPDVQGQVRRLKSCLPNLADCE